jgi:hypothetical protein
MSFDVQIDSCFLPQQYHLLGRSANQYVICHKFEFSTTMFISDAGHEKWKVERLSTSLGQVDILESEML